MHIPRPISEELVGNVVPRLLALVDNLLKRSSSTAFKLTGQRNRRISSGSLQGLPLLGRRKTRRYIGLEFGIYHREARCIGVEPAARLQSVFGLFRAIIEIHLNYPFNARSDVQGGR